MNVQNCLNGYVKETIMIKDNQKRLNRLHVLIDALVITAAYILSWYIIIGSGWFRAANEVLGPEIYLGVLVIIVPVYLLLYTIFHLFTPKRVQGRRQEFANIFKANLIGLMLFGMVLYLGGKNPYFQHFSRMLVVFFFGANIVAETVERNFIRICLRSIRSKGYNQKHVLLIGYSRAAESYIDRVKANPEWGYQIRGILDDHKTRGEGYRGVKVIGTTENLKTILDMNLLDEIASFLPSLIRKICRGCR